MNDTSRLRVEAEGVGWWLDPANAEARKKLQERRPELGQWLDKVEALVQQRLKEVEKQENSVKV